ncbi:MAG TPA: glycosyltransferase family 2 protein [bacterium]|nr:glycosyltransferase family 2 protein [bacterium]
MKLAVGFIAYNEHSSQYLPYFLPSLFQALSLVGGESRVWCIDNSDQRANQNWEYIEKEYHWIQYHFSGANIGFAKAYNQIMAAASAWGADYFLMINPDTFLDPQSLKLMLAAISSGRLGSVSPRLLHWNFKQEILTDIIDSDGIALDARHHFWDKHQGQKSFSFNPGYIFGATGAAALFNMSALEDVAFLDEFGQKEYLDEMFFMYKEDIDLAYRLQLAGWSAWLEPRAKVYHDRSASAAGNKCLKIWRAYWSKSRKVKGWSFYGQALIYKKYLFLPYTGKIRFLSWLYYQKRVVFTALFSPYLLKELKRLKRERHYITWRQESLKVKIPLKNLEKMMFDGIEQ